MSPTDPGRKPGEHGSGTHGPHLGHRAASDRSPLPAPRPAHRARSGLLISLAVLAILVATLHTSGDELPAGWTFRIAAGDTAAAEVIQNLLLFIPLGFALALRGTRRWWVVAAGAVLSFTVECIQQSLPGRDPSAGDIVLNTISTALGGAICWTAPRWLNVSAARATVLSLAVGLAAAAAWLGTGALLQPRFPPAPYYDRWTPDRYGWGHYRGRVLAAALGPLPLRVGPIGQADEARALLTAGAPVRLDVETGPAPHRRALLLLIHNGRHIVFYVAVAGTDVLAAYRTRASALTLEQPELALRGALAGVAPGDTAVVAVWRDDTPGNAGYCVARDAARACGLGHTMGDGWKLIYVPRGFPSWAFATLNALWMAGWTIGIGWCGRRHPQTGAALALVALTIILGPRLVGLNPTPLGEIAGAVGGVALGMAARSARKNRSSRLTA